MGWLQPPPRAKKKLFLKWIWPLGLADPPPRAMKWLRPPPKRWLGVAEGQIKKKKKN
jgi:hypothetical protein